MTDRLRGAVVLSVVVLAVGACGSGRGDPDAGRPMHSPPVIPGPTVPGTPGKTLEVRPPPPPLAWAGDGRRLAVTTWGSSSCPVEPTDVVVVGPQEVRIVLAFPSSDQVACTADMAPTTSEIELPEGISTDEPLTVLLDHEGTDDERVVLQPE